MDLSGFTFETPPSNKVQYVRDKLRELEVSDFETVEFILYVVDKLGLYWRPIPAGKINSRDIERMARKKTSKLGREAIRSQTYQTVRGGRIIPLYFGSTQRQTKKFRRSEPEITYAAQVIEYRLRHFLDLGSTKVIDIISSIFHGIGCLENLSSPRESIRKRLERAEKMEPFDYECEWFLFKQGDCQENLREGEPFIISIKNTLNKKKNDINDEP